MFYFEINNWFRALARFCDYSLFFMALGAVTLFLPYFYGPLFYYFLALGIPVLWVPVEAALISKWGTTPGKALFGLSVRDAAGRKLSYGSALRWSIFLPTRPGTVYQKTVSWKRKLFAFLTSTAFVVAATYGNVLVLWSVGFEKGALPEGGWVQYSSADAGFKVCFPTDPQASCKELVIPDSGQVLNYQEITSDANKSVHYSVSHLTVPSKWRLAGNTMLLKGVLKMLVQYEEGSVLLDKEFKMQGGHRVLDYRLKQEGGDEVSGRLIIVNGVLYKLSISYPPSQFKEMKENPFLDSFEIS